MSDRRTTEAPPAISGNAGIAAITSTTLRRLKYVATINDAVLGEDTDPDFEMQYIDISNVDSSGTIGELATYRFEEAPSRARRRVRDGDVIISTVRTYLQAIAQINRPSANLIVSTGFAVVRPRPGDFDARYCKYVLREPAFLAEVEKRSVGVSYPAINASELVDIHIPIHPLPRQRTIADYLDRETVRIDALIATKERLLTLLAEKRRALITHAVTRGLDPNVPLRNSGIPWLGEIPAHWEITHFKHVCELNPTVDFSRLDETNEVTFLPMDRIKSGYYIENAELLSKYNSSYNPFAEGDILVAKVTPCFENGNIAIANNLQNNVGFGSSEIFVIRPRNAERRFIFFYLQSHYFKQQGEASMTGAGGLKRVSPEFIRDHTIGLPPEDEQTAIADFLDKRTAQMRSIAKAIGKTIRLLKERRMILIASAVTGQVDIGSAT